MRYQNVQKIMIFSNCMVFSNVFKELYDVNVSLWLVWYVNNALNSPLSEHLIAYSTELNYLIKQ